ncbi:MAG: ABC transporter permease subunit [Actinomycetota bacterium]|nr:ABC transporter permease subunit [Actinomycetota bacterium]
MPTREETTRAVALLERKAATKRGTRRFVVFIVFLAVLALAYTGYKAFGEAVDDAQTEWAVVGRILPRTDDLTMPPIVDIITEFGEPPQRNSGKPLVAFIAEASLFTLREAALGFFLGMLLGLGFAIVMLRSRWLERGISPYLVASQTVPLVAIAPIIVIWGSKSMGWLPFDWQPWMSVSIIATYLTFFPIAMNGIKGFQSADPASMELMRSYAAGRRQTLIKLQFPAALPYLFTAFKLAATVSIVGAIVGEISGGVRGGLGRLILDYASRYTTGPSRLYASVIGAAVLGIIAVGLVTIVEYLVVSRRQQGRTVS